MLERKKEETNPLKSDPIRNYDLKYINIHITIKLKLKYSAQPISHIHQTGAVGLSSLKKTFFKKVYSIKGGKDSNRIFLLMNVSRQSNGDKYYLQWPLKELVL